MKINVELKNVTYNKHNNFEEIDITENGEYTASEGYDAIGKAVVNVEPNLEEIEITENGEYLPSEGKDGFSKVDVLVQPNTQEIEITENGEYTPDEGYTGFSKVDVNVETYEPPLNLVLINPTDGSSINLPITFQWNIDNLEQGETPVYYLFVDNIMVYKGNDTSFTMQNMPIAGKVHTCYLLVKSENRSGFINPITFNLPYEFLYGFDIDQDNEDPTDAVIYTDDCLNFIPAGLDDNNEFQFGSWKTFIDRICRPVMLRIDGTVDYELDHENLSIKLDGTSSDIQNLDYDGNAMVEFKKVYTKVWQEGNIIKVRFCDVKLDSDYQAWAFINDEGDEQNELYISIFQAIDNNNKLMSICGNNTEYYRQQLSQITDSSLINTLTNGYGRLSFSMAQFVKILHILISKSRDYVNTFGLMNQTFTNSNSHIINGGFIGNKTTPYSDIRSFYIQYFFSVFYNTSKHTLTILDGIALNDNLQCVVKNIRPYSKISSNGFDYTDFNNVGIQYSSGINNNFIKNMIVKNGLIFPNESSNSDSDYWKSLFRKDINSYYHSHLYGLNYSYVSPKSIYGLYICSGAYYLSTFITYLRPSNT